jgi:hypothetical protein
MHLSLNLSVKMQVDDIIVAFLGLFEFYSSYRWFIDDPQQLEDHSLIFPESFSTNYEQKALLIIFLLMLGLQRLSFATSGKTIGSYVCLITAHVAECGFFYYLALNNRVINPDGLSIVPFVQAMLGGKIQLDKCSKTVLFLLPTLILFFTMSAFNRVQKND